MDGEEGEKTRAGRGDHMVGHTVITLQPEYPTVLLLELNLFAFLLEKTAYHTNTKYTYIYIYISKVYIVISMSVYRLLILVL